MGAVRTGLRMVALLVMFGLVAMIIVNQQHPLEKGAEAPHTHLRMLDGNVVEVPFHGDLPMFVNVWATWCPPCLQELPELQAASERYEGRLRFVGAAVNSRPADMKNIVTRFGVTYPVGELIDPSGWNAESLPSSYLVGTDGKVLWSMSGALDGKAIDAALGALLPPR